MNDHYSILGLTKNATVAEIKAAYRRLVKIYHPDKNPNNHAAVEVFRKIQQAYELLSNPITRSKYDAKINYTEYFSQQKAKQPQRSRTKQYSFTDEDLKKRQYYKEHYKRKASTKQNNNRDAKKQYNETRYILVSIPLAMALLLFIINVYKRTDEKEKLINPTILTSTAKPVNLPEEKKASTSDAPYDYYFGVSKIDRQILQVLQVTNVSGVDAVVCIVDALTDRVIRHYYIANNFYIYFEYLPEGNYYLKNYLGTSFTTTKKIDSLNVIGLFEGEQQFQSFPKKIISIDLSKHDTLSCTINFIKNKKSSNIIGIKEFFNKGR